MFVQRSAYTAPTTRYSVSRVSWGEDTGTRLTGRHAERGVLDRLVAAVRDGESRALVVHGEAGVGKTALLEYLAGQASGCRVVRAAGIQSEMELAFAGLHQLSAPMLDRLDRLPRHSGTPCGRPSA